MPDNSLRDLIRISHSVGADVSLVQGGGGNTSAKSADMKCMFIKASGTTLAGMDESRGWRCLDLAGVLAILRTPGLRSMEPVAREQQIVRMLMDCCADDLGPTARPSVESHLHAFLARFVVHLHPVAVGAYVCARRGQAALKKLFAREAKPPLWIPYIDPGFPLARKTHRLVEEYRKKHGTLPAVIFLEKHGLIVSADSAAKVLRLVRSVIATCKLGLKPPPAARAARVDLRQIDLWKETLATACSQSAGGAPEVEHHYDATIAAFLTRPDARRLAAVGALTPDEVVYANGSPLWLDTPDPARIAAQIARRTASVEKPPAAFLVDNVGLFVAADPRSLSTVRDVVTASLQIRMFAASLGGPNPLNVRQRKFITHWEAETFRRKLAAGK